MVFSSGDRMLDRYIALYDSSDQISILKLRELGRHVKTRDGIIIKYHNVLQVSNHGGISGIFVCGRGFIHIK